MRVLILHSDVAPDAPPEEHDTILTAQALRDALELGGHRAFLAPFLLAPDAIRDAVRGSKADVVFNLVENVLGQDGLSAAAPFLLEKLGVPYTGSGAAQIAIAGDKPAAKRILRAAGLPTPDWSEPPQWNGFEEGRSYIVKSATEDASIGLDDDAVIADMRAAMNRVDSCRARFGGRWFAEAFVDGREFNVAVLEDKGAMRVLPIPEMRFEAWPAQKPRIVGYRAKWDPESEESNGTARCFGIEHERPALAVRLSELALEAFGLFGLKGYARVDFRVDAAGAPTILELNPNPCLEPEAGFAVAAGLAGIPYCDLAVRILEAALHG
jgi:D-alanine-D-alanine ligase